jgi:hypothetical protein
MPLSADDLSNRFDYHKPADPQTVQDHEEVRAKAKDLAVVLNRLVPPGREHALAITKLEEAMMWANAGIARENHEF